MRQRIQRRIKRVLGATDTQWARVVMNAETEKLICATDYRSMSVVEISGSKWRDFGFSRYASLDYPDFDICKQAIAVDRVDLVIAEQVLEHVLWPYRAVRNVFSSLSPGGFFLTTTPFLLRIHNYPVDCCRWTEVGIKHLLAEGGFPLENIKVGSWGNRACVRANFFEWTHWKSRIHSLKNESDFPVVVWAFARKPLPS